MSFEKAQLKNRTGAAEDPLEELVRTTVGPDLDRQKGRAAAAFLQSVHLESTAHPDDHRAIRRLKWWAGAASALAACFAVVVGLQVWMNSSPTARVPGNVAAAPASPVVDQVEYTRNLDGGTVLMGDSPVRVIGQQTFRQTQWVDPHDGATYSITEPREKWGYQRVQPY